MIYQGLAGKAVNTGTMPSDGRTLVIAATDAVIFLDTVTGETTRTLKKPAHIVTLSSDGKWLGTSRHHYRSVLRTAERGEAATRFEFGTKVIFSPDARWMALSTGGEVRVHKMELPLQTAYPLIQLGGETAYNPPLEFSPDSRMFAVPFNRMQVRLYETSTGRVLATLTPSHPAPIMGGSALEFTADGQWLLAAKNDGETVSWHLPVIRAELAKQGLNWTDPE